MPLINKGVIIMAEKENPTIDMEFDGEKFNASNLNGYADKYSEAGFFDKIVSVIKKAGLTLIYKALQLYYVTENPNCPMKIKAAIFAALGYFISPIDLIPDITPIVGYSDDAAAIALALSLAQIYISDKVKQKAKDKLVSLFGRKILAKLN